MSCPWHCASLPALLALGVGLRAQAPALVADLQALQHARTREAAITRLSAAGTPAVAPLCKLIDGARHDDAATACAALRALLAMGPRGREGLAQVRAARDAVQPRLATAEELDFDRGQRRGLDDRDLFLALEAVERAFQFDGSASLARCAERIRGEDLALALATAFVVAEQGTQASECLPALLDLLAQTSALPRRYRTARAVAATTMVTGSRHLSDLVRHAIVAVDPQCPAVLTVHIARLSDAAPQVRARAAQALGQFGAAAEAVPFLATAARDANLEVACEAVTALGMIGKDSPAARRVLQICARSTERQLATRATAALAQLDAAKAGAARAEGRK